MGASFTDEDVIAEINITPFVDIILVVLIIFMVTATQIVASNAIPIELPDASTGEETDSLSLGLTLTAGGELLLDGAPTSPGALRSALTLAKQEHDEVVCLIAADEMVAHGRVVWLLDLVKSEGITKFAINIDKASVLPPDPATLGKGEAASLIE